MSAPFVEGIEGDYTPVTPTRRLITMSRYALASACQYHLKPEFANIVEAEAGEAAQRGTFVHSLLETHVKAGPEAAELFLLENRDSPHWAFAHAAYAHFKPYWATVEGTLGLGDIVRTEIPIAYNPFTRQARWLEMHYTRDYSTVDPTCEMAGTADILIERADGLTVIDWKTGRWDVDPDSPQMLGLATMASALLGKPAVETAIVKVRPEGVRGNSLTHAFPVDETETMKRVLTADLDCAQPVVNAGCRWCPARARCPAHTEALAMAPGPTGMAKRRLVLMPSTPQEAAYNVAALEVARDFLSKVEENTKAYADRMGGIAMPDGTTYIGTDQPREYPVVNGASEAVLAEHGALDAIERKATVTWTAIEAKVGKEKAGFIRNRMRSLGAVNKVDTRVYRFKRPEGAKKASKK